MLYELVPYALSRAQLWEETDTVLRTNSIAYVNFSSASWILGVLIGILCMVSPGIVIFDN